MSRPEKPFFVGYLPVPPGLRKAALAMALLLVAFMTGAGLWIGGTQDNPGPGAFRFDYGRQTVTGVVEMLPYPPFHVTEGNDRIKPGHTFMLTAGGKAGVSSRANALVGQRAIVSGVVLQRGSLDMLQVRGGRQGLRAAEDDGTAVPDVPVSEELGRWRLAGEICDGKCLAGAMRPGRGLAHKACANLCLIGEVPPIFVSTQPVEGSEFLLVVGPDGGLLPKSAYDYVAQFVQLEGDVARHGGVLVLKLDPASIEVIQ